MKQVSQSIKDGRIVVLDVPAPTLRPHGVLVDTAWSLISAGTERAKVDLGRKNLLAKARSRPDQVAQVVDKVRREGFLRTYRTVKARLEEQSPIGYSSAGVVSAAGELASGLKPGDRVACGGGGYANHAEVAYVPGALCARVPEGVSLEEAAFATVGAVALQGVRQSGVTVGDRVVVIGLGLLGQITVQLLRAAGCDVSGVDPDDSRCAAATGFGARTVTALAGEEAAQALEAASGHEGFDAAIITAGTSDDGPIRLAGRVARDRGTVVVVGDVGMNVPRAPFYEKELTLKLSRSYGPGRYDPLYEELALDYPIGYVRWTEQRNMGEFLRLVAEKRVDVRALTTHRFPVEQAASAYATLADAGSGSLGVLLEYAGSAPRRERILVTAPAPAGAVSHASAQTGPHAAQSPVMVGVSFLGAGNFATATLLPALAADPRSAKRGVFTTSGLSARDVADRHGFAYCAASADEVLADADTHGVIVATRHASHADLAGEALRAGKTVFVEKPLAVTEEGLAEVVAAQRESGGRLTVGFNRRFSPLTRRAVSELSGRTSPACTLIRVNAGRVPDSHWVQLPEEGGGRIVGEVCHFVDLAACLMGGPPALVYAASADRTKALALSDTIAATLSFSDGSVASLVYAATGDTAYPKERVEVYWGGRVLVLDDFRTLTLTSGGRTKTTRLRAQDKGHAAEMGAFLDLVQGRAVPELTFADCVSSTAATLKIIESLTSGLPVSVPDVAVAE